MNELDQGDSCNAQHVEYQTGGRAVFIDGPECLAAAVVNGWVIDARSGGLVRGRLHEEGHIAMIEPSCPLGVYEYVGVMEGDEYIMSVDATKIHFDRLREINSDTSACDIPLPDAVTGRIIDARSEPHDKILIVSRQYIINRQATKRHLSELIQLNDPHVFICGQFFQQEVVDYMNSHPGLGDPAS